MQTIFIGRHPITDGVYSDVEAFEELLRLNERLKEDADAGRPVVYLLLQDRKMAKLRLYRYCPWIAPHKTASQIS